MLELAMPAPVEQKKVRGKKKKGMKKKKADPRKLEVLDACFALARACTFVRVGVGDGSFVGDDEDARRYYKRAKKGYEVQLGPDSEKALDGTFCLIMATLMSNGEKIEKLRVLLERMVGALGEENIVTLGTLNSLGDGLQSNGESEEARKVYERCLAGKEKVLGEYHRQTLATVRDLGEVYDELEDYEKALEYFERALKGSEKTLGKTHPDTLNSVISIAIVYEDGLKDFGKAEDLYQRALEGHEAQLGKDHKSTKRCAVNFATCLAKAGENLKLRKIIDKYPHIMIEQPVFKNSFENQKHSQSFNHPNST